MNNKKINIGIIFGGKSAEHEISIQSAKNVFDAIDKNKYKPILIKINKNGEWLLIKEPKLLFNNNLSLNKSNSCTIFISQNDGTIYIPNNQYQNFKIDVVFPILHGPFGEDGTIQGLLKLTNLPFIGASVLGSAIGMDKDIMKRLLRDAGIPIGKFIVIKSHEPIPNYEKIKNQLGSPFFLKPANMGSSIGISKVHNNKEYKKSISKTFNFDTKIIIEEYIQGREIECAVLGNDNPIVSILGEIKSNHEFYSYDSKYIDQNGAILEIPAKIDKKIMKKIQRLAIKTFKTLSCEGLGRVDFFLKNNNEIIVNEINTIPGFTKISMYPKLWEASGITYTKLIDQLIQLAVERFKKEKN